MNRYDPSFDHVADYVDRWNAGLRRVRGWTIALGVLLILVGIASLAAPMSLYALVQGLVSAALVVGGVGQVLSYARTPELFRSPTALVMGVLNALLGVMLMTLPAYLTATTVAFLLAFLFVIAGAERVGYARRMRYFGVEGSGLALVTGVVNVIVGIAFLLMPVVTSLAAVYVVGAYLTVGGATLLVEGASMRPLQR